MEVFIIAIFISAATSECAACSGSNLLGKAVCQDEPHHQHVPVYSESKDTHDGHTLLLQGLFPLYNSGVAQCPVGGGDGGGGESVLDMAAVESVEAMVFATHRINANSSLLPNVKLTFCIQDTCSVISQQQFFDRCLSSTGNSSANLYNLKEALAASGLIVSGFFANVSNIASLLKLFRVPVISYGPSAPLLEDEDGLSYFLHTFYLNDSHLALAMADIVNWFKWPHIGILHSSDDFGRKGLETILSNMNMNNSWECSVVQIPLPSVESTVEFDRVAAEMKRALVKNGSAVLIYGYATQAKGIMRAIKKLLSRDCISPLRYLTWVSTDALVVDSRHHTFVRGMLKLEHEIGMSSNFHRYFSSLTPRSSLVSPYFCDYWEAKFDCSVSGYGVRQCSDSLTLDGYLQDNQVTYVIDLVYAFAYAVDALVHEHCPRLDLCSEVLVHHLSGVNVNGTMVRDYLLYNLSLPGLVASEVGFNFNEGRRVSYRVKNLQEISNGFEYVLIGTWDSVNGLAITGDVEWNSPRDNDSCIGIQAPMCGYMPCESGGFPEYVPLPEGCWMCVSCPGNNSISDGEICHECDVGFYPNAKRSVCVENSISYLSGPRLIPVILAHATCLGIAATVMIAMMHATFFSLIKPHGIRLRCAILLAAMLLFLMAVVFLDRPSPVSCVLRRFLGLCFGLCFCPLVVKTNTMYRIAKFLPGDGRTEPRFISDSTQFRFASLLYIVQVAMTLLWFAFDHSGGVVSNVQFSVTEIRCGESFYASVFVTFAFNIPLSAMSARYVWDSGEDFPEDELEAMFFKNTFSVAFSLATVMVAYVAGILGAAFTTNGSEFTDVSSMVMFIIIMASLMLAWLFLPTFFFIYDEVKNRRVNYRLLDPKGSPSFDLGDHQTPDKLVVDGSDDSFSADLIDGYDHDMELGGLEAGFYSDLISEPLIDSMFAFRRKKPWLSANSEVLICNKRAKVRSDVAIDVNSKEMEMNADPMFTIDGRKARIFSDHMFTFDVMKSEGRADPAFAQGRRKAGTRLAAGGKANPARTRTRSKRQATHPITDEERIASIQSSPKTINLMLI